MRNFALIPVVAVVLMCAVVSSASAEMIGLSFEHYPRTMSIAIQVTYDPTAGSDANTGLLTATGTTMEVFWNETGSEMVLPGIFDLSVEIDKATGEGVSGDLTVTGMVGGLPQTLFASETLTDFGFGGDDLFEFIFEQNGAGLPPEDEEIGIILSGVSIVDAEYGDPIFGQSFDNNANGYADTFYLPEPASIVVLLTVGGGMLFRRRRS